MAVFLRASLACTALAGAALLVPSADAANCKRNYVAALMGMQEVPANPSPGLGCGRFVIDTEANTLTYRIVVSGLSSPETAAHIHGVADPGVNAGVVHPLPLGTVKTGVWNYPQALENDILAGRTYVNVHTVGSPGGEVRGQIVTHVAVLDGLQEVPPVTATTASGFGLFVMDPAANLLKFHIAYGGLTSAEIAAHIHGNANYGTSAGVVFPLPPGSPKTGVWAYSDLDEAALMKGLQYVNIHSAVFGGGEIRGQITPHVIPIDPLQEVPPTPTSGCGCGLLGLNMVADTLGYDIRSAGLSAAEIAAHIHGFAAPGVNAGVVHPLPGGVRKLGVWAYPAASEMNILNGLSYINIHTAAFAGGEIRGQDVFTAPPCPEDIDGDGVIGQSDLADLLARYLSVLGDSNYSSCADIDSDGDVDQGDLAGVLAEYGNNCPQ